MARPNSFDQWFARWKKLTHSLFGVVEDIGHDEAREILSAQGIDTQEVGNRLRARLSAYARSLRAKGEPVPDHIREALETFRPENAPPRNAEELGRFAERHLTKLLHPVSTPTAPPRLAFSYRRKTELLPEDRAVLDRIAEKVEERIKPK